ncbi:MAG: hypothetical protein M3Q99_15400 [Acidobacteriota bacterium]|nr:hypothetical protein [Acidobacteriota bacterium]
MKTTISIFFLFAFIFCIETKADDCSVEGRVINDFGNPVSNAEVYFGGAYTDDVDSIIVINKPEDSGNFILRRTCSSNFYYLFVTSAIDRLNSITPIEPPFTMHEGKNKSFPSLAGVKITKQNANVGDIKIQTVYQKVKFNFLNELGEKLLPSFEDAANVRFTVRNQKGQLGGTTNLSREDAFNNSFVSMNLPEGKWIVEIELKRGKGKTLHPDKLVEISRNDNSSLEITLNMSKRKYN